MGGGRTGCTPGGGRALPLVGELHMWGSFEPAPVVGEVG